MLVVILLGSPSDAAFGSRISDALQALGVRSETRIGSAHKTPQHLLDILHEYEDNPEPKVFITVAGRSNALSGFVDAQVSAPVIACPPSLESFAGVDIWSSLRMPSGVAPAVVLDPANAALLAAKMLGLADTGLRRRLVEAQEQQRHRLVEADAKLER